MDCLIVSSSARISPRVSTSESACDQKRNGGVSILPLCGSQSYRKLKAIRKRSPSWKPLAIARSVAEANNTVTATDPSQDLLKFVEVAQKGNLIPLYRCIFSDHLTPVLAYRCLVKEDDSEAPSFLFESVEQGHKSSNVGRFSIVGAQPAMEIVAKENTVTVMDHEQGTMKEEFVDDPMAVPPMIMSNWKPMLIDELPAAFCDQYSSAEEAFKDGERRLDILVSRGKVINRPLAGTRRRGKTEMEDEVMERELLNDEKECAEHIMLVDLGRNDVGKVSKPGSVKVEKLMNVERYSHVMHISSTVTGELLEGLTCWDALRAALPVGTVSGAPKVPWCFHEELFPSFHCKLVSHHRTGWF